MRKEITNWAGCILAVIGFIAMATFIPGQTGENLPAYKHSYSTGTAPVSGTNCIQTGTLGATITGGSFKLNFAGAVTSAISWVGENRQLLANIQTALDALSTIGAGNCYVTAGTMTNGAGGTFLITMINEIGTRVEPLITVQANNMTGGAHNLTFAITTAGVEGDCRICPKGTEDVAIDTGAHYVNVGIPKSVQWVKITAASTATPTSTPTATATPSATATATSTPTPTP